MTESALKEAPATEVAVFQKPRLPWNDAIEEKFGDVGVTKATWKALTDAVFPNAQSVDSVILALSYCKARKLDPFKRCVHIVPMWSKQKSAMVDTVWPGIAELRTTAFRTGSYAGKDAAEFGPDEDGEFGAKRTAVTYPTWCRITLHRRLGANICKFAGPQVYWLETYGRASRNDETPNSMWLKRPRGQIEKCAEAAALRSAYPEEIGNEYVPEEMAGHTLVEHENGTYSPVPAEWPGESSKDAWGGPLKKTEFKAAMMAFSTDLEACEDYDQLVGLLNVEETIDLLAQCQRDKPSTWFGIPDSDVLGFSARIEARKVDLAAEQPPGDA